MVVLGARDVRAAAAFYRDKFGFEINGLWGEDGHPATFAIVGFGAITIALQLDREVRPRADWAAYLYISDVDAYRDALSARSVPIRREPQNQPYGCRDFDVSDLDGHILAFGQDLSPDAAGPGL